MHRMSAGDETKVGIDVLYGTKAMRPSWIAKLQGPPPPTSWDFLRGIVLDTAWPALLFALAFTALKFAMLGHF